MKNKICLVTGANAGIGFETAKALAARGAHLVMVCRDLKKGEEARRRVIAHCGHEQVDLRIADLASQPQIRALGAGLRKDYPVIDVLVNNAGTWISKRTLTAEGIETVFAVNHLSYFLLTHLLYDQIARSEDGRIINVASDSHFLVKGMYFDDLNLGRNYHGLRSYAQSKLANVLFTYELHRRKEEAHVSVNALQPGLVVTDIGVKHTSWLHRLAWKLRRSGGLSPEEGAATSVYLATVPEVREISGKYWDKCRPKSSSRTSYDEAVAARLWELSKELCGIGGFFSRR